MTLSLSKDLFKACKSQLSTTSPVPSDQQRTKVQSQLFVNLLYLKYFEVFGRYLPAPVPKFPACSTRPFYSFLPLLFSVRRRNKPRRDELSADQLLLDLCIAN